MTTLTDLIKTSGAQEISADALPLWTPRFDKVRTTLGNDFFDRMKQAFTQYSIEARCMSPGALDRLVAGSILTAIRHDICGCNSRNNPNALKSTPDELMNQILMAPRRKGPAKSL